MCGCCGSAVSQEANDGTGCHCGPGRHLRHVGEGSRGFYSLRMRGGGTRCRSASAVAAPPSSASSGSDAASAASLNCRCLIAKLFEVCPKEIDCRQGLAEIRTRWCKKYKDLDKFRPPERNTLRPVWWFVFPLVLFDFWRGPRPPLYSLGEQGYMESPSRVRLEPYSEWVG